MEVRTQPVEEVRTATPHKRSASPRWDGRVEDCDININGLASRTKVEMLEDFLRRQEIDFLFLPEVVHSTVDTLCSYKTHINVGTAGRGTAMVTRNEIMITNITRLLSGRGITAEYMCIWLVKVYVPAGTAKRQERERFYKIELSYLLRASQSK